MATPYDTSVSDAEAAIGGSDLPQGVKDAILNVLSEIPPGEDVSIVDFWQPGDNIPDGVDVLFVKGDATQVAIPDGVPIVIFETDQNTQVTLEGTVPTVVQLGAGDDTLIVDPSSQNDHTVHGGAGDDSIVSAAGDDTIYFGDGSDTVDGGAGFDLGVIQTSFDTAGISWEGNQLSITNLAGETSVISDVEYVQFDDGAIIAAETADLGVVARMYETLLDRYGDFEGVKFWFDIYESGDASLHDIAQEFLNSEEFTSSHGSETNAEFVDNLYEQLFGREPDAAGAAYWTNLLDDGAADRADIVVAFAQSAEGEQSTERTIHVIDEDDNLA
ncbi:DUF4214 domain-containing protein [Chelatococcus asaccharovorans]|uniref:Uncharacterized protein DUF4214 n=1 Tax=Chelatococcus asaccharovorans TaxID=28210 RepID=A0A2V3TSQ3_9HYPH|nr:DUF4214 domain-containing protein [Chelatococcus asaccharovorans]MBS7704947.1 DUF4214 domain-containing protein [Chelatococcus asaccharovorans]PXW51861.1 uncharacterized protein DUF4214 [Chelatococcus asaccharovorans]CAH1651384.1 conserved hypothetical protein [Chelatococcus asaccharovorans]CAH1686627.1 conserved hypothetical protein [Chelatococcus asaccharovorans]